MRAPSGRISLAALCAVALLITGGVVIVGCGSDSKDRATATATGPKATPGSPERAVLDFWRYFQVSSWPSLAAAYDDDVLGTLGSGDVMSAVALAGGTLQKATVRKVDAVPARLGTLVTLTLRSQGKDETVSFLVHRDGKDWRIMYDTLLAGILPTYVQSEVAARAGDPQRKPSQETINAGNEAARLYRQIFVPTPRKGRVLERVDAGGGGTAGRRGSATATAEPDSRP